MTEIDQLVATLTQESPTMATEMGSDPPHEFYTRCRQIRRLLSKRRLKLQGMTYRDLAASLGLSEPSVKRLFASRRFSIDRLVQISNLLGFTLAELAQEAAISEGRLQMLTESQERERVSDEKLLLVTVCAFNQWAVTEVVIAKMTTEMRKLRQRFAELHDESLLAPLSKRRRTGMIVAMREWELAAFTARRRE